MQSSAWQQLFEVSPQTVALIVLGVLFAIRELVNLKRDVLNSLGLEKREEIEKKETKARLDALAVQIRELKDSVDKRLDELQENSNRQQAALREDLADKINDRYKRYFSLGYIPTDEFDEFIQIHDAYKGIGGNHSGDAKFEKCIKSLKVMEVNNGV